MRRWWDELVDGLLRPHGRPRRRRAQGPARRRRARARRGAEHDAVLEEPDHDVRGHLDGRARQRDARRWRAASASTSSARRSATPARGAVARQRLGRRRAPVPTLGARARRRAATTDDERGAEAARLPRLGAAADRRDRRRVLELTLTAPSCPRSPRSSASRATMPTSAARAACKDLAKLKEQYDA